MTTAQQLEKFVDRFKVLADEKKLVTDDDIDAIVAAELYKPSKEEWRMSNIHITAGNLVMNERVDTFENDDGKTAAPVAGFFELEPAVRREA